MGQPIQLRNFYGFASDVLAQPRAVFDSNGLIYIVRHSFLDKFSYFF
jgi:hypothetical protein